MGTLVIAVVHAAICIWVLIVWRRFDVQSTRTLISDFLKLVDKRQISSGRYTEKELRRRVSRHMRKVALALFIPSLEVFFYAALLSLALFGAALAAHVLGDAVTGIDIDSKQVGVRTIFLALGLLDAASFGFTILAGVDIDMLDADIWRRSVNFWLLSSVVAIGVAALLQVLKNIGTWLLVSLFPCSFYYAFHDGVDYASNSKFEQFIFRWFNKSDDTRSSWLNKIFDN